jgi:hypothetical protein
MPIRRSSALLVLIAAMSSPAASAAADIECGTVDPATNEKVRATLTLDPASKTTIPFKRSTDTQQLLLRFKVTGCDLPAEPAEPRTDVLPKQNAKDIPNGALKLAEIKADDAEYSHELDVDPTAFDPDTYAGFYEIRAPYLITSRTPIELSRSEDNQLVPVAIGAIGGIAGLGWFLLLSLAKGATTKIKRRHYVIVFFAAAIAGIVAVESAYRAQEVWSIEENLVSAFVAAFTGATTGAMATAISVLFPEPRS